MGRLAHRLRVAWDEFVGPEATPANHLLTVVTTVAGAVAAPVMAHRRGAGKSGTTLAALLAVDLSGGVYVNNTRACARWYERAGQSDVDHLTFAALHVHPAAVAWLDRGTRGGVPRPIWAAAHYGYVLAATGAIRALPRHRRPLGVALTAGGLALDLAMGPSRRAPWFASTYYPKLVLGHAAAALWSDHDLEATPPATSSAAPSAGDTSSHGPPH